MSQFMSELDGLVLQFRTAGIVAQDRYEAHAAAEVEGPQAAPACGKRMEVPMTANQQLYAYHAATRREVLREKAFEEAMTGAGN